MDESTKQFYRDIRSLKDRFIKDVGDVAVGYGMDVVPLSFDDIFNIWNPGIEKIIEKSFKRTIERKVKKLKKELNPWWRKIRGWFGNKRRDNESR